MPPEWWSNHHLSSQQESWYAYLEICNKWLSPDILIINGDCIEGSQPKQSCAEVINADRNIQCKMAVEAIDQWKAKSVFMTFGSKYHVGEHAEDFEYTIADKIGATIEGRLYLTIESVTFDVRHKIGTSSIPHGRATALLKAMMWDLIEEANGTGPKVDVIIRSHAHYYSEVRTADKIAIITPGLQLKRGRYGTRECEGEIHWGAIRFTIDNGQIVAYDKIIRRLKSNSPKTYKIE